MKKAIKVILIVVAIIVVFIVCGIVLVMCSLNKIMHRPEIIDNPKVGEWYRIPPDEAKSSDGSDWHGLFRKGKENKIIVYFYGGGVSTNEFMAARPEGVSDEGFYVPKITNDGLEAMGIGSNDKDNPFKDWTMLVIPYSTGDWHCGTGEFKYTDLDGNEKILYHNGYTNFNLYMKKAMTYVDKPDDVLITGFSGGGFAAALLANDAITNYFAEVENVTVFAEASFLLYDNWKEVAENVWHAPKSISDRLMTNNIVLDSLKALSADHPTTKILFSSSVRDNALARYQNYYSNGKLEATEAAGDVYQNNLKGMVNELKQIPNTGVLIWDGYGEDEKLNLTGHTLMFMPQFYKDDLLGTTMAKWLINAVNGKLKNYGLNLLNNEC